MRSLIRSIVDRLLTWKDPLQESRNNLMRGVLQKDPLPPPKRTQ
jgi:hypothetical protein